MGDDGRTEGGWRLADVAIRSDVDSQQLGDIREIRNTSRIHIQAFVSSFFIEAIETRSCFVEYYYAQEDI